MKITLKIEVKTTAKKHDVIKAIIIGITKELKSKDIAIDTEQEQQLIFLDWDIK